MSRTDLPRSPQRLTPREQQIVRLVLRAQGVAAIARTLVLSEHTVKDHLKSVYQKLQVHSARELLVKLHGQGPAPASTELPLLDAAESIMAAAHTNALLSALLAAVNRCVSPRALHVVRWRLSGTQVELTPTAPGMRVCLVNRVWAEAATNDGVSQGRLSAQVLTALGLSDPTWGFHLLIKPHYLLLVAPPTRLLTLPPQDYKVICFLVRLTETRAGEMRAGRGMAGAGA